MVDVELAQRFADFADTTRARSPLYSRLSRVVASEPRLAEVLRVAPAEERLPVLLLAAVHHVVLCDPSVALAAFYPSVGGTSTDDPGPAFIELCRDRGDELRQLVATRRTQTNEIGRSALLLPALGALEAEVGPLALIDVGASAGLNLLLDRFRYRYTGSGSVVEVGSESAVTLECGTRGAPDLPPSVPCVRARWGLDRAPVDLHDGDAARWLVACTWADQLDRVRRLRAAIEIAGAAPVEVLHGDAVDDTVPLVQQAATIAHPVVLNSWVLSYLPAERRAAYVERLDAVGRLLDLSWVYAEAPADTAGLPTPAGPLGTSADLTALVLVRWRAGERSVRRLATCHPHGFWLHWHR